MHRLESENVQLREKIAHHIKVYSDQLVEIVELKATLDAVRFALAEKEQ